MSLFCFSHRKTKEDEGEKEREKRAKRPTLILDE